MLLESPDHMTPAESYSDRNLRNRARSTSENAALLGVTVISLEKSWTAIEFVEFVRCPDVRPGGLSAVVYRLNLLR